jgi:hypothetical protein
LRNSLEINIIGGSQKWPAGNYRVACA